MSSRRLFKLVLFLSVLLAPFYSFAAIAWTDSCNGTTSCTLSGGVASGDLMVAFAFRDGNNTAPTVPGTWTVVTNAAGSNSNGAALAWKVASSGSEASGTFTSATSLIVVSFSGADTTNVGISGSGSGNGDAEGSSTTVRYPGVTMSVGDGTSWIISCAGTRAADSNIDQDAQVPTNLSTTHKAVASDATDEAACWNSNGGLTSFSLSDVSVGGTSTGWHGKTLEIRQAAAATDTPYDPFGTQGFFGT